MNMENIIALGAVVGFVNGASLLYEKDYKGFVKFAVGVVVGALIGVLHYFGVARIEDGLLLGLSASGAYKALQVVKGK